MTSPTSSEFLALHGLAVKKAGTVQDVAILAGLGQGDTEQALATATESGRVMGARGRFMVTPAGRSWLDEQYPLVYAAQRADDRMNSAYDDFERVNRDLLSLMTRWQTVTVGSQSVPNDHTDRDYDDKVIDELGAVHERALPVLRTFVDAVPRLRVHLEALEHALSRILAGETDYVSGARIPSYHTVWFEMHEDLLRILGRTREA